MISDTSRPHNYDEANADRFSPQTPEETAIADVARMMLRYHIIRVQLDGARPLMTEEERADLRRRAIEIRRQGFREEQAHRKAGYRVSYDDEMLRREGTRIAYMLARRADEEAARYEEQVLRFSVEAALNRASASNERNALPIAA